MLLETLGFLLFTKTYQSNNDETEIKLLPLKERKAHLVCTR